MVRTRLSYCPSSEYSRSGMLQYERNQTLVVFYRNIAGSRPTAVKYSCYTLL